MSDPADLTISEAGRLLRSRILSPVELVEAVLARIAARNPLYNAFLSVDADAARAEARNAEATFYSGDFVGPLHGIPYGVKDNIDARGKTTTCNSRVRRDHRADADADVVARLRGSGAILIGKLALHEFARGGAMWDLPWPPARNPWDPDRHPGGSSSGSGAAVAAGMLPAAVGTDTGGSIRHPATACGLVGLKPTYDAISRRGIFPLAFSLDTVGLLTRTVEDNALFFRAAMQPHNGGSSNERDCLHRLRDGIHGLRIGLIEHFYVSDVEARSDFQGAMTVAVNVLRSLGAEVAPVRLSPLSVWAACGQAILQSESYVVHEASLREQPQDYSYDCRSKLLVGRFVPASKYLKAQQMRAVLMAEFEAAMRDHDVLVTLSSMEPPAMIDDKADVARSYSRHARMPFNLTGTPAISVPIGLSTEGLPIGMQIAGRAFDEATVFRVAWAYCSVTGSTERRPAIRD
jgi:aspartyl-tRNA(Asn)/glutamyl-tRNA(Gln) amidotransferase subunit A